MAVLFVLHILSEKDMEIEMESLRWGMGEKGGWETMKKVRKGRNWWRCKLREGRSSDLGGQVKTTGNEQLRRE